MILEVVKTIKIRGVGVFPQGTIFNSEKAPIPKEVKTEYKARTGSIIRHFPAEEVEPEKEIIAEASVPEKEPVPSPQVEEKAAEEKTKPSQQVVRRKIRR
jgi:hypothetical protein